MSVWKLDETLLIFVSLISPFKISLFEKPIKHSTVFRSLDETSRSSSKLLRCASNFQLSSQCFIWWWNTASHAWYISSTGCNIGGRSVHKNWTKPRKLSTALSNHGEINVHYFLSFLVSCILFLFQYHFQKCRMNKNRVLTDLAKEKEQSMNFETSLWIKSKIFKVWLK